MKMRMMLIAVCLWFMVPLRAGAQSDYFDSLRAVLPSLAGQQRLEVLFALSNGLEGIRPADGKAYGLEGLQLALALGDTVSAATLLSSVSYSSSELGNFLDALKYGYRSLELSTALGDPKRIASANSVLGIAYVYLGQYSKAIQYHLAALRFRQDLGLTLPVASTLNNIGVAYHNIGQYARAIEYYRRSLETHGTAIKVPIRIRYYTNIGFSFYKMGELDSSYRYLDQALRLIADAPYGVAQAYLYYTMGLLHDARSEVPDAFRYLTMSLENYTALGQQHGQLQAYNALASLHRRTNGFSRARSYADSAVALAKTLNVPDQLKAGYETLYLLYRQTGPLAMEYRYFRLYADAKDSLNLLNESKQVAEIAFEHEMKEQHRTIELLKKEKTIAEMSAERDTVLANVLYGGIITAVLAMIFLYRINVRIRHTNQLIAQKNEELKRVNDELQVKISEVHLLTGFLPICSNCKKIRDDSGTWEQMELYISKRSEATFSHGICPDCMKALYGKVFTRERTD